MKIELGENFLMIVPETEFEADWLVMFVPGKVFHKTGLTPSDYLGLKLVAQSNPAVGRYCSDCGALIPPDDFHCPTCGGCL